MMYTLHKLPEGFIITSDEKPIKGDLCFDLEGNPGHKNQLYIVKCLRTSDDSYWVKHSKKLIAQQDQIDFSNLTEEEQKEIGWFDKIINDNFKGLHDVINNEDISNFYIELIKTYTQELLADRMFTLEDIKKAWKEGYNERNLDDYIQSLSQPKSCNIEIETECSVCGLTGVHKMSCKTSSLRTQQPRLTNGKIKITKVL